MNKLLVHICCGPCFIAPHTMLRDEGDWDVTGYWFNPNIHPVTEYQRRLDTLREYAAAEDVPLIERDDYALDEFLRQAAFRESERCRMCYYDRLRATAIVAKRGNFDAFTSTLLYSRHQEHELIRAIGESLADEVGVPFFYRDFRPLWGEGIRLSKERGMYRQPYCGCIYSERDRYRPLTTKR
ncbi:MAG: epoxyqueuosine reductase QueH [Candidatus Cloacimonetes bacterium]|nr:epoxyqueuosine reductase QueH [Candidatus Cloacimonadota bacterium]